MGEKSLNAMNWNFPRQPDRLKKSLLHTYGGEYDEVVFAAQKVIDQGEAALVPSIRPAGIKMVSYGEADDPFAASINVNPNQLLSADSKKH